MQHSYRKLLCVMLALCLLCMTGCLRREEDTGAGYHFTCTLSGNPDCLDPQFTDDPNAAAVLDSMYEGLMRIDAGGSIVCGEAESYTVSDDGLQYMFNLRDDCFWFNASSDADRPERVTARDYVCAFRRLLDPATRSPYAEEFLCLKNAIEIHLGKNDVQTLGVSAPDATTVLFELAKPEPEFLSLLTQPCAAPCNEDFFLSTDGRYGLDVDTILCNGPFYPSKWNYDQYSGGNFITMHKNPVFYNAEQICPSSLQFTIMHNAAEAKQDFADGNTDVVMSDTDPKDLIRSKDCTVQSVCSVTYGLVFNPDNLLLKNEDLRKALAYGIDRTALEPMLSNDLDIAYGLIPPGITMLGRSYREMYADEQLSVPYDSAKAREHFVLAAGALPLNEMNTIQIMMPSTILDTDALLAMCQEWQDLFGYYIGIETVSPEEFDQRMAEGNYSMALLGIKPERNSCYAAIDAFRTAPLGLEEGTLDGLMQPLSVSMSPTEALDAYAAAEQLILDTNSFIPLFYKNLYLVHTATNTDIRFDPFTGSVCFRDAKHFA